MTFLSISVEEIHSSLRADMSLHITTWLVMSSFLESFSSIDSQVRKRPIEASRSKYILEMCGNLTPENSLNLPWKCPWSSPNISVTRRRIFLTFYTLIVYALIIKWAKFQDCYICLSYIHSPLNYTTYFTTYYKENQFSQKLHVQIDWNQMYRWFQKFST